MPMPTIIGTDPSGTRSGLKKATSIWLMAVEGAQYSKSTAPRRRQPKTFAVRMTAASKTALARLTTSRAMADAVASIVAPSGRGGGNSVPPTLKPMKWMVATARMRPICRKTSMVEHGSEGTWGALRGPKGFGTLRPGSSD